MHRLKQAVTDLAVALASPLDDARGKAIDQTLVDFELTDEAAIPGWVLDMLSAWTAGAATHGWVRFEVAGLDASDTLEFLRILHEWVPVELLNEGERWTFTATALSHEAIVTFEGDAYLVKPLGSAEPD